MTLQFYAILSCSKNETTQDEDSFEKGTSSTTVTGANLASVSTDCRYSNVEESDLQKLACKMLLKNESNTSEEESTALVYDEFNVVTAVEGVAISWGVPADLDFTCSAVQQASELFCFRESTEDLQDFSVILELTDILDNSIVKRLISTAVSANLDQSNPPEAPSNLTAIAVSSNQINLTFTDNSASETGFEIDRSLDEVTWSNLTQISSQSNTFPNTGLQNSTTYYYRVRACNMSGCSEYSNTTSATTNASGASSHIIFASSGTFNGNLGGLSGADLICASAASGAGLIGNWKAILSTSAVHARDRITITGEIRNTNNDLIASDFYDLWDRELLNGVTYDENAQTLMHDGVWSGTGPEGYNIGASWTCSDWTTSSVMTTGWSGYITGARDEWVDYSDNSCNATLSLYCIDGQ